MNAADILAHVDHTFLKQTATWEEIQTICEEAINIIRLPSWFHPATCHA